MAKRSKETMGVPVRMRVGDHARLREIAEERGESLAATMHHLIENVGSWLTPENRKYLEEVASKERGCSHNCDCDVKSALNRIIAEHRKHSTSSC